MTFNLVPASTVHYLVVCLLISLAPSIHFLLTQKTFRIPPEPKKASASQTASSSRSSSTRSSHSSSRTSRPTSSQSTSGASTFFAVASTSRSTKASRKAYSPDRPSRGAQKRRKVSKKRSRNTDDEHGSESEGESSDSDMDLGSRTSCRSKRRRRRRKKSVHEPVDNQSIEQQEQQQNDDDDDDGDGVVLAQQQQTAMRQRNTPFFEANITHPLLSHPEPEVGPFVGLNEEAQSTFGNDGERLGPFALPNVMTAGDLPVDNSEIAFRQTIDFAVMAHEDSREFDLDLLAQLDKNANDAAEFAAEAAKTAAAAAKRAESLRKLHTDATERLRRDHLLDIGFAKIHIQMATIRSLQFAVGFLFPFDLLL
jgi:hypothetical protein